MEAGVVGPPGVPALEVKEQGPETATTPPPAEAGPTVWGHRWNKSSVRMQTCSTCSKDMCTAFLLISAYYQFNEKGHLIILLYALLQIPNLWNCVTNLEVSETFGISWFQNRDSSLMWRNNLGGAGAINQMSLCCLYWTQWRMPLLNKNSLVAHLNFCMWKECSAAHYK